jgi:hypothetical protein
MIKSSIIRYSQQAERPSTSTKSEVEGREKMRENAADDS